jgi:hypothetical protein
MRRPSTQFWLAFDNRIAFLELEAGRMEGELPLNDNMAFVTLGLWVALLDQIAQILSVPSGSARETVSRPAVVERLSAPLTALRIAEAVINSAPARHAIKSSAIGADPR